MLTYIAGGIVVIAIILLVILSKQIDREHKK